jgi:hypothetical protein
VGDALTSDNDSPRRAGLSIDEFDDLSIDRIIASALSRVFVYGSQNHSSSGFELNLQAREAQFRSVRSGHMLNSPMRKSPVTTKTSRQSNSSNQVGAAAAEVALKAHVLACDPDILAEMAGGDRMMQQMTDMVNLTEAPEDAVCSLVIDLLQYCEREKIDWTQDVMSRAREHLRIRTEMEYSSVLTRISREYDRRFA